MPATEVAARLAHYDFVLDSADEPLPPEQAWWDSTLSKGRREACSDRRYDWPLPFMPLEIAKLSQLTGGVEMGPHGGDARIAQALRALIREKRKVALPYDDLLRALHGVAVMSEVAQSLTFDGFYIVFELTRNADIKDLNVIQ